MKRLLILSGKGGTGKTTTAAAFIRFSNAQAMADCDVDAPNLHIVSEMKGEPVCSDFLGSDKAVIDPTRCVGCMACLKHCRFDAVHIRGSICEIDEYACEGCGVCAYVCPKEAIAMKQDIAGKKQLFEDGRVFSAAQLKMGRGNSGKLVTEVKVAMMKAARTAEFAVIDGSPGIGCPVIASVSGMDLVLIVAEPSLSGLSDLTRLFKTTETLQTRVAVCVNKWDTSPENTEAIERFCTEKQIPFVGKIPYDPAASAAINRGLSIADMDCPAKAALYETYQQVRKLI